VPEQPLPRKAADADAVAEHRATSMTGIFSIEVVKVSRSDS